MTFRFDAIDAVARVFESQSQGPAIGQGCCVQHSIPPIAGGPLIKPCLICGGRVVGYDHAISGTAICSVCYEKPVRDKVDIR